MKQILRSTVLVAVLFSASMFGKTWQLEFDEEKVGSIDFPETWETNQSREFVDGWSPDKSAHVVVQIIPMKKAAATGSPHRIGPEGTDIDDVFSQMDAEKETDQILADAVNDFKDDQVDLDQSSKKQRKSQNILGPKGFSFAGKRNGKPLAAGTGVIVAPNKQRAIVFTYWCLTEAERERQPEIGRILQSIKATGSR